jgi:predicted nucleotidyltransferase component of viral defense system
VETTVGLTVRNLFAKSKIARLVYVYSPTGDNQAQAKLKVEVNLNEHRSQLPLTKVRMSVPADDGVAEIGVPSYDLNEMLGTKLRALLQREQGRDLFDLWRAWEGAGPSGTGALDPAAVASAFRFYMRNEGSTMTRAEILDQIDRRMHSAKFLADMKGFLPAGEAYDPETAYAVFVRHFLPHL